MSEEINKNKLLAILEDPDDGPIINQIWIYRQEIRLLHRKIDEIEKIMKKKEYDIMDKHKLNFIEIVILSSFGDKLNAKKE